MDIPSVDVVYVVFVMRMMTRHEQLLKRQTAIKEDMRFLFCDMVSDNDEL